MYRFELLRPKEPVNETDIESCFNESVVGY
jgi:hypothetical protein